MKPQSVHLSAELYRLYLWPPCSICLCGLLKTSLSQQQRCYEDEIGTHYYEFRDNLCKLNMASEHPSLFFSKRKVCVSFKLLEITHSTLFLP